MTIDDLITQLEHTRTQRFVKREDVYAQLDTTAQELNAYAGQPLTAANIERLDDLALSLKRQRRSELSDVIEHIDAVRAPYRPQQATVAYDLISTNFARYDTRIQEIHSFLDDNQTSFDDLALTKDWLENNSYLKNKRKTNKEFDEKAATLVERLNKRMNQYSAPKAKVKTSITQSSAIVPPRRSWYERAKTVAAKATVGVSAALLTLSTLPTSWYAPFYQ